MKPHQLSCNVVSARWLNSLNNLARYRSKRLSMAADEADVQCTMILTASDLAPCRPALFTVRHRCLPDKKNYRKWQQLSRMGRYLGHEHFTATAWHARTRTRAMRAVRAKPADCTTASFLHNALTLLAENDVTQFGCILNAKFRQVRFQFLNRESSSDETELK